jgi:hypothetical protein
MSDQPAKLIAPMHGPNNAVPWPTPLPPHASVMTFSGNGDATTQEFALPSDAALRIAVEKGPMVLRVLKLDGTEGATSRRSRLAAWRWAQSRKRAPTRSKCERRIDGP